MLAFQDELIMIITCKGEQFFETGEPFFGQNNNTSVRKFEFPSSVEDMTSEPDKRDFKALKLYNGKDVEPVVLIFGYFQFQFNLLQVIAIGTCCLNNFNP